MKFGKSKRDLRGFKKIFFIILNLIQILLIGSAFTLHILSKKKMGVMRHLVYLNNKLESVYDTAKIINIASFIALIAIIFSISFFLVEIINFKSKNKITLYGKYSYLLNMPPFLFGILLIAFLRTFSADKLLSYYYASIIFTIAYILELIKILIIRIFSRISKLHG